MTAVDTTPISGVRVFAPAKVNLCLHVTGQRDDGFHELDSLVAFADVGDDLWIQVANTISVTTEGPEAKAVPSDMNNLVLQVAALFKDLPGASFLLTKKLPVASGIGGGSADAAAAFRGLMAFWSDGAVDFDTYDPLASPLGAELFDLGADIAMCLRSEPARATGRGETLTRVALPNIWAVLVNPRVPVSTPSVFKALDEKDNAALGSIPEFRGVYHFVEWLQEQRNDLEAPALSLCPEIGDVRQALLQTNGCLLARMSGSGATCFGLYETQAAAEAAAHHIKDRFPTWWVAATWFGDQARRAQPQVYRRKVDESWRGAG